MPTWILSLAVWSLCHNFPPFTQTALAPAGILIRSRNERIYIVRYTDALQRCAGCENYGGQ